MKYVLVKWKQNNPRYPILLYSELNDARLEVRKIDVYADGHMGFADPHESTDDTGLAVVPFPELSEITKDTEFLPAEISKEEFEAVWARRRG